MGHLDSPLSALGQSQARNLAGRCAATHFDALYSSDLGRAVATAEAISEQCARKVICDTRLRERNMGIFQGLTFEEMEARYPEQRAKYREIGATYVIPSGESAAETIERSLKCLDDLAKKHANETIIVITHGGVLMGLFEAVLGLPFGSANRYRRSHVAWNVFSRHSGPWLLETWGDVAHLENEAEQSVPNQSTDPAP
jgi:probable phosphoglycerate mutase